MNKTDVISGSNLFVKEISIDGERLEKTIFVTNKDQYLLDIPSVKQLIKKPLILNSKVTIFVGENGSGKSTLLEAIASFLGFNPEGGDSNTLFQTKKTNSLLSECIRVVRSGNRNKDGYFLRAESFYNVATYLEDSGAKRYGGNLHEKSHGESFLSLVSNRFEPNSLYIFDEIEAALSPSKLMTLMCYMHELEKNNSQFIISTHSLILMSYPNADVFKLGENGIRKIDYKDSEHYKITKSFIEKPDVMFKHLFDEDM